ncbi:hypothetical protein LYSBPC_32780 [Lysinibacillus piscis]|uniref:Uncharacterized protein n=1 Tax=Lysinibacillus piscis TaxID=2518931 RepID=A0ABQ5NP48_9BACI|nr:hypothetical protein LYSBPC_32780 [Lysinibacillus sp. KH24]
MVLNVFYKVLNILSTSYAGNPHCLMIEVIFKQISTSRQLFLWISLWVSVKIYG